ncbi:MAG: glycoside hydrolase family 30 beta sandwich domain-containing protein, partial [Saprospiraceae bacterium]
WFKNWCVAPVIVDTEADEVYYTPIYYTLAHFSKYIRPGAKRIGLENSDKDLQVTAVEQDDNIVVVLLNEGTEAKTFSIDLNGQTVNLSIDGQAIQTVVIPNK